MKRILSYILIGVCVSVSFASCNLDESPVSQIAAPAEKPLETRAEIKDLYDAMYLNIRGTQEFWYLDVLVNSDVHADNAYRGTTGAELYSLEAQTQDGDNPNIKRDWNNHLKQVANVNRIISNIDSIPDKTLTLQERKQWKSEALIWRAWMFLDMVRMWGDIVMITREIPTPANDNMEQYKDLFFPARTPVKDVYLQIVKDLEFAMEGAPEVNSSNKFLLTRSVAKALLAKAYAEKPIRDYAKTIQYCQAVEADGFDLMPNYSDLFSVKSDSTDVNYRNTKESIFEIVFPVGSGNWVTWMFGIDLANPRSRYDWAKWVTPSRDLIEAFESEGDTVRMNQSIVWASVPWSNHYPADHYPFMYKTRSAYNSILKIRLADILLLKAEAYVATNQKDLAVPIVNRIRERARLKPLPANITASAQSMKEAVLKERRLELAFEGQRWFDLVRNDVVKEVMNTLNSRDEGRVKMAPLTDETIVYPIPQEQLDLNASLKQNPGY